MVRFHGGRGARHGIGAILLLVGLLAALPVLVIGRGTVLVAALLQREGGGASGPGNAEIATRRLLDALTEKRMHDVVLAVLDRVANDPGASAELRQSLSLRRADALTGLARREPPGARRSAMLEQAAQEIDRCLAATPTGDEAIAAYTQKGNLLVERGRIKLAQAKRPGEDGPKLMAEAIPLFDAAIAALEAPPRDPGVEVPPPTNAEDAVLASLRDVDARLAQLKNAGKEKEGDEPTGGKKARRTPKKPATDVKLMEKLEDRQDELRGQLLQTRLLIGNAYFEKSKALAPGSAEWKAVVRGSAERYRKLFEKYPKWGAGLYARYYEGRNYLVLAQSETVPEERRKLLDTALLTLSSIRALDGESGFVPTLRAKSINASLECWLEQKLYDQFDDRLQRLSLLNVPADRLDAEWLGMKYRSAQLLSEKAEVLSADQKGKKPGMLRDAKKLATDVARHNKDFARESRALLEKLGRAAPDDDDDPAASFAAAFDVAAGAVAAMQEKQAEAKEATAAGKAEEAAMAVEAAGVERTRAMEALRRALARGDGVPADDLNRARSLLTYLLYDARRLHDAAAMGTLLAERYPNAKGARQSAKIAMAAWQQLGRDGPAAWHAAAKARCADVAALIMRTWPKEPEGVEAAQIVVASAAESHDADRLVKLIADVPRDSAKGPEVLLRAGGALWREIIERRRLPDDVRPAPEILAAWRSRAVEALDAGLAAMPAGGAASPVAVAGGLARCQMAIEEGDLALAAKLLEHPSWGGWTVLSSGDAASGSGPLAENAATVALRFFIQSQQLDKAQQAFDKLEAVAGTGPEATAKLTNMYLSMGRDLQGQLEALAAKQGATQGNGLAESEGTALGILAGFEKFLEGVAKRDAKVASQMWVATTYLSLGSGSGSGTVVPRAKASGYLARAAEVYEGLLKRSGASAGLADGADEIARFVPSIRLKLASVYRELGRWDEALGHVDWILSDAKRQNSLEAQIQAAELLQAAGEKATDGAAAARFLREAIAGRKTQGGVAWGWGGIANRLARQAADPKAIDARAKFFSARLNVVRCRLALLAKPGQDRAKLLQMAFNDVAVTYRLYPDLGGDAFRAQFDALLKQIQKERGEASPRGLAELDETPVAAS
jgi:hypothetical protein